MYRCHRVRYQYKNHSPALCGICIRKHDRQIVSSGGVHGRQMKGIRKELGEMVGEFKVHLAHLALDWWFYGRRFADHRHRSLGEDHLPLYHRDNIPLGRNARALNELRVLLAQVF